MNDFITQDLKKNILKITLNNPLNQNTLSLDIINTLKQIIINAANNKLKESFLGAPSNIATATTIAIMLPVIRSGSAMSIAT